MTIFPSIFHKKCQAKRLENESAGYYAGHRNLSKRYMITNAYYEDNNNDFFGTMLFEQLDPQEYPSADGRFKSVGGIIK